MTNIRLYRIGACFFTDWKRRSAFKGSFCRDVPVSLGEPPRGLEANRPSKKKTLGVHVWKMFTLFWRSTSPESELVWTLTFSWFIILSELTQTLFGSLRYEPSLSTRVLVRQTSEGPVRVSQPAGGLGYFACWLGALTEPVFWLGTCGLVVLRLVWASQRCCALTDPGPCPDSAPRPLRPWPGSPWTAPAPSPPSPGASSSCWSRSGLLRKTRGLSSSELRQIASSHSSLSNPPDGGKKKPLRSSDAAKHSSKRRTRQCLQRGANSPNAQK